MRSLRQSSLEAATVFIAQQMVDVCQLSMDNLSLKSDSAEVRLERVLRHLGTLDADNPHFARINNLLSNAELAALIAVSPEHLSRMKRRLISAGKLKREGRGLYYVG